MIQTHWVALKKNCRMQNGEITVVRSEAADLDAILCLYRDAKITGKASFSVTEAKAQLTVFARYPFFQGIRRKYKWKSGRNF